MCVIYLQYYDYVYQDAAVLLQLMFRFDYHLGALAVSDISNNY